MSTQFDRPAVAVAAPQSTVPTGSSPVRRRRRRRKPIKAATVFVHRWLSLLLGLALLAVTTSGAIVVYSPEWTKWTNSDVFATATPTTPVSMSQALDIVDRAYPDFDASTVNLYSGLFEVSSGDSAAHPGFYGVDPGTGTITGQAFPERGFMAFMNQLHECFLTCEDYPGYVGFLTTPVPTLGMGWLTGITWAGVILGAMALMLVFLAVSGIWLWYPGIKKWAHGFRIRWHKGRYARDYDLHQVAGMAAVPFLLVWGLTGAGFEFPWVAPAWYAVTGGQTPPEEEPFVSADASAGTPDIGLPAAIEAARRSSAGDAPLVYAALPVADDATSTYQLYFSKNFDQYRFGAYPGEYGVAIDRHDAARMQVNDYGSAPTLSNQIWDNWGAPMLHYGQSVNGWWRIAWFGFGLTPLLLAVTGISTWLAKRTVRKRRRAGQAATAAAASA